MRLLKAIKLSRLVLAVAITLLMADTVPHPSLSNGLLENSWGLIKGEPATAAPSATTIADRSGGDLLPLNIDPSFTLR